MTGCKCSGKGIATEGRKDAPLLLVTHAPLPMDVEKGSFFYGKQGSILWNALKAAKIDRADVRIVSVICGAPLGRENMPTDAQVEACAARFEADLKASTPKVVLVLGSFAMRKMMGLRGKIDDMNGYIFYPSDGKKIPVVYKGEIGKYAGDRKCSACKGTGASENAAVCPKCLGAKFTARKGDPKYGTIRTSKNPMAPASAKYIIPTLHPETVRMMGFKPIHAFSVSVERAMRALRDDIHLVDENDFYPTSHYTGGQVEAVSFDIENDIDSGSIYRIGFSWRQSDGRIFTWTAPWNDQTKTITKKILSDPYSVKVGHNILHDISHLEKYGIQVNGPWYCTMQGGVMLQPDLLKGLGRMAPLFLDLRTWKEKSESEPAKYNALDAKITLLMYEKQVEQMEQNGMLRVMEQTMDVYPTLLEMTNHGIKVDTDRVKEWTNQLKGDLQILRTRWLKVAGQVNYASTKQLAKYLYDDLGLPMKFNKYGRVSTDEDAIKELLLFSPKHKPILQTLLDIRETSKQLSTYALVTVSGDGKVHPKYTPAGMKEVAEKFGARSGFAVTGRLASNNPNIQNQGEEARKIYIPSFNRLMLVEYDYSQLELRIIAALSGDKALMKACEEDVHAHTMDALGIDNRTLAKGVIYGTAYGAGGKKLAKMLRAKGIMINEREASAFQMKLFNRYPAWYAYRMRVADTVSLEKSLTNAFGRVRPFYGGSNDIPKALDFEPQSNGADLVLSRIPGMMDISRKYGGHLLTSVHDSFLQEIAKSSLDDAIRESVDWLEAPFDNIAPGFRVPVGIKVSKGSWGEMEKYGK